MTKRINRIDKLISELCFDGVEFKSLMDVFLIKNGRKDRKDAVEEGVFRFFTRSSIPMCIDSYSFDGEAIICPGEGNIGAIHYVNEKFDAHQRTYVLQAQANDVSTKFVYYFMATHWGQANSGMQSGSTVSSIRMANFSNFLIPIPPLIVQEEIVKILDNFTKLEAELEAELESRKKQYEYYWDELLTFGERVRWIALGDCIEKNTGGGTPSKAVSNYWNGDIPWASVGDLSNESIMINSTRNCITLEGLQNSSSHLILKGDVIVAVKISPGKMKIAGKDIAINQDLRGLSLKSFLNNKFLTYYFQTINIVGNGTIVKAITVNTLNRVKIPNPPLSEQIR